MPNDEQRQIWNNPNIGAEWVSAESISDVATLPLFEALDLRPGERVLDLACGGGKTTVRAAQAVGDGGHVTGVDISEGMLALSRRRVEEARLANVELALRDAQTEAFPGAPFDAVLSQLGVMFFDDTVAAFENVRAQMRPGGRLAFVVWQPQDRVPWSPAHAIAKVVPSSNKPAVPRKASSLGDPAVGRELLHEAGFTNVGAELVEREAEVPADYEIPESVTVATVAEEYRDAVREAMAEQRASFIEGAVARLFCPMVVLTAEAPS